MIIDLAPPIYAALTLVILWGIFKLEALSRKKKK